MSESSPIDIKRLKSLRRVAVDAHIIDKHGPADAFGWIAWGVSSQGQTGQFISPERYGRLGTPMSISCWRPSTRTPPVCTAGTGGAKVLESGHGFNAIALQGVHVRDVDWIVEKVERAELAALFSATEIFVEWLSTPPGKRASTLEKALQIGLK